MEGSVNIFSILLAFLVFLGLKLSASHVEAQTRSRKSLIPALYVFGDSTTDPGNNNGLDTIAKSNFPPYGRDFLNGRPTGRFTNGKLITDIISGLVGLPDVLPAYLDPEFRGDKLLTGASFGSAGAGLQDTTSLSLNVIPLKKQIENFRHYRSQLADMIGQQNASRIVSEALFAISMGTNDFVNNYFLNPETRKKYSLEQFEDLLQQSLSGFIQLFQIMVAVELNTQKRYKVCALTPVNEVIFLVSICLMPFKLNATATYFPPVPSVLDESVFNEGATRLAILGLPPFGCCPSQITLHNMLNDACDEEMNEAAISFNEKTVALIQKMNLIFPGLRIAYLDTYEKPYDILNNPTKYGFEEARKGCCGSGLLEIAIFCNMNSPTCPDASKYVFWDSVHPTTATYSVIANDLFQKALQLNLL